MGIEKNPIIEVFEHEGLPIYVIRAKGSVKHSVFVGVPQDHELYGKSYLDQVPRSMMDVFDNDSEKPLMDVILKKGYAKVFEKIVEMLIDEFGGEKSDTVSIAARFSAPNGISSSGYGFWTCSTVTPEKSEVVDQITRIKKHYDYLIEAKKHWVSKGYDFELMVRAEPFEILSYPKMNDPLMACSKKIGDRIVNLNRNPIFLNFQDELGFIQDAYYHLPSGNFFITNSKHWYFGFVHNDFVDETYDLRKHDADDILKWKEEAVEAGKNLASQFKYY